MIIISPSCRADSIDRLLLESVALKVNRNSYELVHIGKIVDIRQSLQSNLYYFKNICAENISFSPFEAK